LRNSASSRRTNGTNPAPEPNCRTKKAPDPASATASSALAWTVVGILRTIGQADQESAIIRARFQPDVPVEGQLSHVHPQVVRAAERL
jgi:hypothetical protein